VAVHPYGVRDVETLLRLSRSTIRSLIAPASSRPRAGSAAPGDFPSRT
jgi:hypothetical protein